MMVLVLNRSDLANKYKNLLPHTAMAAMLAEKQMLVLGAKMALPLGLRPETQPMALRIALAMKR